MGVGTAQWFYNLAAWAERWRMPRAFRDLCLQVGNEIDVAEGVIPPEPKASDA